MVTDFNYCILFQIEIGAVHFHEIDIKEKQTKFEEKKY
jgi:hypothetical protein